MFWELLTATTRPRKTEIFSGPKDRTALLTLLDFLWFFVHHFNHFSDSNCSPGLPLGRLSSALDLVPLSPLQFLVAVTLALTMLLLNEVAKIFYRWQLNRDHEAVRQVKWSHGNHGDKAIWKMGNLWCSLIFDGFMGHLLFRYAKKINGKFPPERSRLMEFPQTVRIFLLGKGPSLHPSTLHLKKPHFSGRIRRNHRVFGRNRFKHSSQTEHLLAKNDSMMSGRGPPGSCKTAAKPLSYAQFQDLCNQEMVQK